MRGKTPHLLLQRLLLKGGANGVLTVAGVARSDGDLIRRAVVMAVVVFAVFDITADA